MPFTEAIKLAVKRRAHFSCVVCHNPFVEVHHIIPQAAGGSDDPEKALHSAPCVTITSAAIPRTGNRSERCDFRRLRITKALVKASRLAPSSLVNPQQVLPRAEVSIESQALRDLVAGDNLAFDCLVTLVWPLADKAILLTR
jgi:ribosomal protein L20